MSCVWDKTEAAVESFKLEGGAPVGKDMASAEKGNTQEQRKVGTGSKRGSNNYFQEADYRLPRWDGFCLFQNCVATL